MKFKMWSRPLAATTVCCAVLNIAACNPVSAMGKSASIHASGLVETRRPVDGQYFVDFRARPAHLFGHTFIVFGHLDSRGRPTKVHYGGLYPIDGQTGLIVGSVLPVEASVRPVKEDFSEAATTIYRRKLSLNEYRALTTAFRRERGSETYWHLLFFNCNDFAAKMAKSIGLRVSSTLLPSNAFVAMLHALNKN